MKKVTFLLTLVLAPIVASALTLSPSTFTVNNLKKVTNGTTVYLKSGTYTITQPIIDAWTAGTKSNVTFKKTGTGTVVMNGNGFSNQALVKFEGWSNLLVKQIKFVNLKLMYKSCTNSTIDGVEATGQKFNKSFSKEYGLQVSKCSNVTVKNCKVKWTYTGWNGKGIFVWRGTNVKLINNTITGRLRGGYHISSGRNQPKANHIVDGGTIRRDISSGREDHGIYVHDISGVVVKNITVSGFSPNSGGGSIKVKNSNHIEVKDNDFSTSGILGRDTGNWPHFDHIWIHDNEIRGPQGIGIYTPNCNPRGVVIERNKVYNATIKFNKGDPGLINKYCNPAGKNGGVFNNGTKTKVELKAGIRNSGNYILNSARIAPKSFAANARVRVYPNPFSTEFSIITKDGFTHATLIDAGGRIVAEYALTEQVTLVLSPSYNETPAGVYILRLAGAGIVENYKLVRR